MRDSLSDDASQGGCHLGPIHSVLIVGNASLVHTQIARAYANDHQREQAIVKRYARRPAYPVKIRLEPERSLLQPARPRAPFQEPRHALQNPAPKWRLERQADPPQQPPPATQNFPANQALYLAPRRVTTTTTSRKQQLL